MRTRKLLTLTLAALLPLLCLAQGKPKIKSVDLTLPVPAPGTSLFDAREYQFTSAKTEFGDLAATGGITVHDLDWIGDFREDDDGDMFFKDGFTYKVRLQFLIDPSGKYETDYVFKNNEYYIDGTRISVTLNGLKAKVERSAPYVIGIEVSLPVGAGGKGSERDLAQSMPTDYELNKDSYRASQKAYSIAEADAACPDVKPLDVITINDDYHPVFYANGYGIDNREFMGQKTMLVTKLVVDTGNAAICSQVASDVNNTIQGTYNIREVWLSDKVDAVKFIRDIFGAMQGFDDYDANIYYPYTSVLFHARRATLFIPEAAKNEVMAIFSRSTWNYHTLFTIKTYSGDVFSAQRAGAASAKPICTDHKFTDKVAAADKIYRYGTCDSWTEYYYSCRICGECEHDPKHLFSEKRQSWEVPVHQYDQPLADDAAYIGVNAAGQHVWWYSCIWCGQSHGYGEKHISKGEWKGSGNEAGYEQFRKAMAEQARQFEEDALLTTTAQPGTFILKRKSDAKMSPKYQSSVNYALNDNLLDDSILGDDYTLPLNHGQLRSLAVRLVEELSAGEVKPSRKSRGKSGASKSSIIGLDTVFGGESRPDDSPVTRQEMAATLYRALRYIEESKIYSYTEFTSRLDKYSDCGSIAPWATEAMAFMEALGLMEGAAGSTIAPDRACTVEEAIDLTEKCTHAHQLGWYQARSWGEGGGRSYSGNACLVPESEMSTWRIYAPGERVWVTGPRAGGDSKFLPIVESYSGQIMYVDAEWFRPVRKHVYTSKRTITGPLIFQDYYEGVSLRGF